MSSFRRKTTSKSSSVPTGTRVSPGSTSTIVTSTGIPSLDDILGGGLPLSCSLLVLAPDAHSAYGELVQKYFVAQGLAAGQRICVIDSHAKDFLAECMWTPTGTLGQTAAADEEEDERKDEGDAKIKIAWRYEQMKQFRTTVPTSPQSAEDYCRVFDLTCRVPESVLATARKNGQIIELDVSSGFDSGPRKILGDLAGILADDAKETTSPKPLRVCIPSLGSFQWGDVSTQEICQFLHGLRTLLRRYPHACASVSLPPHLCLESWGGSGWIQKLGWLSDASITLSAFTADPSLSAMFSSHHGFVHIHSLPSPHTLLPSSDKFSTLRGLSSSGENNLAFKCMRKRFVIETLHLDLEGGVGDRRTTPATNTLVLESAVHTHGATPSSAADGSEASTKGGAAVEVRIEQLEAAIDTVTVTEPKQEQPESAFKKSKAKKKVAFHSDRPDLYDF
ncbi:PAXNEB-domain-containing protein [Obba rivulosa]|uniref:Elongator complex protein 4 n=1 Tax=Obba rivulosa TaxID=1052685 RepID=A0A8E2J6N4_9APHY|nr:PAXNEB-domain-containing protein [Obba rivulosa]